MLPNVEMVTTYPKSAASVDLVVHARFENKVQSYSR